MLCSYNQRIQYQNVFSAFHFGITIQDSFNYRKSADMDPQQQLKTGFWLQRFLHGCYIMDFWFNNVEVLASYLGPSIIEFLETLPFLKRPPLSIDL